MGWCLNGENSRQRYSEDDQQDCRPERAEATVEVSEMPVHFIRGAEVVLPVLQKSD